MEVDFNEGYKVTLFVIKDSENGISIAKKGYVIVFPICE